MQENKKEAKPSRQKAGKAPLERLEKALTSPKKALPFLSEAADRATDGLHKPIGLVLTSAYVLSTACQLSGRQLCDSVFVDMCGQTSMLVPIRCSFVAPAQCDTAYTPQGSLFSPFGARTAFHVLASLLAVTFDTASLRGAEWKADGLVEAVCGLSAVLLVIGRRAVPSWAMSVPF